MNSVSKKTKTDKNSEQILMNHCSLLHCHRLRKSLRKWPKAILNGHFCVESSGKEINIFPVCVEIYYHEEQNGGIKDPIVYHRNRKKKRREDYPLVFPKGVLHNHVSGVDITFESEPNSRNKYVTGVVRASALIRAFDVSRSVAAGGGLNCITWCRKR